MFRNGMTKRDKRCQFYNEVPANLKADQSQLLGISPDVRHARCKKAFSYKIGANKGARAPLLNVFLYNYAIHQIHSMFYCRCATLFM